MSATPFADLLMLVASPRTSLLLFLLVLAAWTDWRTMRIPNWLTLGGMAAGVLLNAAAPDAGPGAVWALGGLASGLLLLLPLYALRMLGAGDVKLMAMVGAFLGAHDFFPALLVIFLTAGAVGLMVALHRGFMSRWADPLRHDFRDTPFYSPVPGLRPQAALSHAFLARMPYAVSVLLGTTGFLVAKQLGHA